MSTRRHEPAPIICPHCGAAVDPERTCSAGCGRSGGCALVCCPACGQSFPHPRRSALAYRLSLWLGAGKGASPGTGKN